MKKVLLGTSALCAAGLLSAGAMAAEPLKLTVGGVWLGAFGDIVSQPTGTNSVAFNTRDHGFKQDVLLHFKGDTKLDNGLTVGAYIQFRGQNAREQVKQQWVQFKGPSWGEIRVGDYTDATRVKGYTAPVAQGDYLFGTNSPDFPFNNNPIGSNTTTFNGVANRPTEVAYFSPTIAGFQLLLTYAPDSRKSQGSCGATGANSTAFQARNGNTGCPSNPNNDAGQNSSVKAAALSWDGKLGDFTLGAAVTGLWSEKEKGTAASAAAIGTDGNVNTRSVGGVVGWGPFEFGGAYQFVQNARGNGANNKTWDVGVSYTTGPFKVATSWSKGLYNNFQGGTSNATAMNDVFSLQGAWTLGPGIALVANIEHDEFRSRVPLVAQTATSSLNPTTGTTTANSSSTAIAIGTSIKF